MRKWLPSCVIKVAWFYRLNKDLLLTLLVYFSAVPAMVLYAAEEVVALEGGSASLQFSIESASPPIQLSDIRWYFQPTGANYSINITQQATLPGSSSTLVYSNDRLSLTIGQITRQANGRFTLSATNSAGTTSNSTYLIVESKSFY